MSIFAEFYVPSAEFALSETLEQVPDTVVEIDRVAATDELLTPYFWVSGVDLDEFEAVAARDPSVEDLQRLDTFESASLYRSAWTHNVDSIVYAYTHAGATILEAKGESGFWDIRMRFDSRDSLSNFQSYSDREEFSLELTQLYEMSHARSGSKFGLTEKQDEALVMAWEAGYFQTPREAKLEDIAEQIGITRQSLSQRLRRGEHSLIANTLRVTPPSEESEAGPDTLPDLKD